MTGPWGLLPIALPLAWVVVVRLGAIGFAAAPPIERLLGGATCAVALFVAGIRILGSLHGLHSGVMLAALALLAATLAATGKPVAPLPWRRAFTAGTLPLALLAGLSLGLTAAAAFWLPVWQWDALGYHLPFVDFALQHGSLRGVPEDVPYLSTYPHDVELTFVALRAMLPDDRLVDLGQLPFGLLGALATAALAWRAGANRLAPVAGLLWLTLPAVFLQLPTDYIDVASGAFLLAAAYWVLAGPTSRTAICAGIALGLFLGSKPNAPVGVALLFGLLAWRVREARIGGRWLFAAGLLTLALGAEAYGVNLVRHHNPIWPVRIALGPWVLPGTRSMQRLLEAGALAPRVQGPLPWRVLVSWTSLMAPPAFDMRMGGFGPLFPVALAIALVGQVRERSWQYVVPAAAALASPDPAVARYVLAFPALAMVLAVRWLVRLPPRGRAVALAAATGCAAWNLAYAAPGLTGEGPPLVAYANMTESERRVAVGADGSPMDVVAARDRLRPGDVAAYDDAFDVPHLAWAPDLSTSVVRIPDDADAEAIQHLIDDDDVHLFLVGESDPAGAMLRSRPERFLSLFPLRSCKSDRCVAYLRL
ncbi:MAG: hypothetical protein ACRENE_15265 [Polyangiaceae bacterium]